LVIDTEDGDSIIDLDQKWQPGSAHAGRFAGGETAELDPLIEWQTRVEWGEIGVRVGLEIGVG
jgi:hypothetical protein